MKRVLVGMALFTLTFAASWWPVPVEAGAKKSATKTSRKKTSRQTSSSSSTRERFKEIQRTLKERGYDPGPIDGQWGSKSASALKRFEKDNELPADGKLDSLALIMMGLGPKRLASVSSAKPPTKEQTP